MQQQWSAETSIHEWDPQEKQFSLFQEYHEATKELIFLCEGGDFALQGHMNQLTDLISRRQQLMENIEQLKKDFSLSTGDSENKKPGILLTEISALDKKAQQLLEDKIKILKGKLRMNRRDMKVNKAYHPTGKQYEGFFIDCKTSKK